MPQLSSTAGHYQPVVRRCAFLRLLELRITRSRASATTYLPVEGGRSGYATVGWPAFFGSGVEVEDMGLGLTDNAAQK